MTTDFTEVRLLRDIYLIQKDIRKLDENLKSIGSMEYEVDLPTDSTSVKSTRTASVEELIKYLENVSDVDKLVIESKSEDGEKLVKIILSKNNGYHQAESLLGVKGTDKNWIYGTLNPLMDFFNARSTGTSIIHRFYFTILIYFLSFLMLNSLIYQLGSYWSLLPTDLPPYDKILSSVVAAIPTMPFGYGILTFFRKIYPYNRLQIGSIPKKYFISPKDIANSIIAGIIISLFLTLMGFYLTFI